MRSFVRSFPQCSSRVHRSRKALILILTLHVCVHVGHNTDDSLYKWLTYIPSNTFHRSPSSHNFVLTIIQSSSYSLHPTKMLIRSLARVLQPLMQYVQLDWFQQTGILSFFSSCYFCWNSEWWVFLFLVPPVTRGDEPHWRVSSHPTVPTCK